MLLGMCSGQSSAGVVIGFVPSLGGAHNGCFGYGQCGIRTLVLQMAGPCLDFSPIHVPYRTSLVGFVFFPPSPPAPCHPCSSFSRHPCVCVKVVLHRQFRSHRVLDGASSALTRVWVLCSCCCACELLRTPGVVLHFGLRSLPLAFGGRMPDEASCSSFFWKEEEKMTEHSLEH